MFIDFSFGFLGGVQNGFRQFGAHFCGMFGEQFAGILSQFINRQAHAHAKFGVILKQGVRPCRSASVLIRGIGSGGQVAAVNRSTPGGVGDDHAIAKQLGGKFNVWGLAAARASAGELEQRLKQLRILDEMR